MINLFSDDVRRDPYPVFDHMRATAPLFHEPQSKLWFVFDYDTVRRTLNDHDTFSSKMGPDWMIFVDPPRHTKLRGLVSKAFTPRVVANLEPRIRQLSRELLDGLIERGEMDLAADYSVVLPMMVIAEMLGIQPADRPRIVRWSDAVLNMSYTIPGGAAAAGVAQEFAEVTAEVNAYLGDLLAKRRAHPQDDLLTRLAEAELDGERLTQAEILGFFQLLLVAGQETTTNLINNAFLCLVEHPEQLARFKAQPELLPSAIEEVLRFRSPLQWMFRYTRRAVELHGQTIPERQVVLAMIGSANRDPRVFPDPNRFDITRDPNPHIAFGHGIHFCLGAPLSRLETRIALADLFDRLPNVRRASDEPWEPRRALHVLGPHRLPIRFEPVRRAVALV